MRNDLDRPPQIIAATLLGDDGKIDLTGCKIALFGKNGTRKALIMPQIEISFGAVIGNKDLTMLKG